nr:hypothetical protein [Tanacetum cinerariifolium]
MLMLLVIVVVVTKSAQTQGVDRVNSVNTELTRKPTRKDAHVPQASGPTESVADEAFLKELGDKLVRAATTASSLEAEQDSGGGTRCQETMRDTIDQTRFERVSKQSNDSLLARGGEEMFVAGQNENVIEKVVDAAQVSTAATTVTITAEEITLAQALEALKTSNPKVKGIIFQEPDKSTTTTTTISSQQSQDKGKRIMIEEPMKPKKKDQIGLDEEVAKKSQAEFDEEERLAREKSKKKERANITLIETLEQSCERKRKESRRRADEKEVVVDAIPLAVKSLRIVDWKIHKEEKKREDLEDLLVKARYGSTRPVESMDYLLWSDMKTMFEPHVEDESMQIYIRISSLGRIVEIKSLLYAVGITAAQVYVNTALMKMPIILERPLLATAHAQVDIFRKTISLEVGSEKVIFKIWESMQDDRGENSQRLLERKIGDEEDDLEEYLEDPEECGEDKANTILGVIHDKLNNNWFNNTSEDKDDLEWILDYLKPRSYDGFIDLDETYNKRRCRLLGMTYEEPTPILIKKAKVTQYTVGPGETYTKVKLLGVEKIPTTMDNVAAIRARLMKKMAQEGNNQAKT